MPVTAVDWREDAIRYATGDEAQALIRECEFFFVYKIVIRFVYGRLFYICHRLQYIKILSNV